MKTSSHGMLLPARRSYSSAEAANMTANNAGLSIVATTGDLKSHSLNTGGLLAISDPLRKQRLHAVLEIWMPTNQVSVGQLMSLASGEKGICITTADCHPR